jgi:hypothetical protein
VDTGISLSTVKNFLHGIPVDYLNCVELSERLRLGGYFISYRKIEQWIAACRTLIRSCRNLPALNAFWSAILQEAEQYTEEGIARLEAIWQQQYTDLIYIIVCSNAATTQFRLTTH